MPLINNSRGFYLTVLSTLDKFCPRSYQGGIMRKTIIILIGFIGLICALVYLKDEPTQGQSESPPLPDIYTEFIVRDPTTNIVLTNTLAEVNKLISSINQHLPDQDTLFVAGVKLAEAMGCCLLAQQNFPEATEIIRRISIRRINPILLHYTQLVESVPAADRCDCLNNILYLLGKSYASIMVSSTSNDYEI